MRILPGMKPGKRTEFLATIAQVFNDYGLPWMDALDAVRYLDAFVVKKYSGRVDALKQYAGIVYTTYGLPKGAEQYVPDNLRPEEGGSFRHGDENIGPGQGTR